ncbi:hypothetical protein ACTNDN_07020 [Niallia sp. HCP3S3_B10]|uniref:hypothetical protein n=1 Tax=Niallia sp. HCP3S3_B10 TaxID=3438944 RepID=UPI003F8B0984
MKIIIRKDALELYIRQNTDYHGHFIGDDYWEVIIEKIAGKTLEVDTEQLFKSEFNTKEIFGVTKKGIRIPEEYVEQIIDDQRIGKAKCEFCNCVSNSLNFCTHCGKVEYLEPFINEI